MNPRTLASAAALASAMLAAAGLASPALAQDAPASFTGPRIEAVAGWDQLRFDLNDYALTGTRKTSGLGWGVSAGYDAPLGSNLVAGIETGITFSNADAAFTDGVTSWTRHARRDLEISGRLGARLGDRALVYAKAGYTNFQLGQDSSDGTTTSYARTNLDGLRLGTGIEYALGKSAYWKAEYRYSNYQDGVAKNDVLTGIGIRF